MKLTLENLKKTAVFIFTNLGPLIVFYSAHFFWGLKTAIAATAAFTLGEVIWKLVKKQPITKLFAFSATITLVFGAVDLYSKESFLFKYEAAITNAFTGIFFAASMFGKKSLVAEVYERNPKAPPLTPDMVAFFQVIMGVWVIYFFLKSIAYLWIAAHYTLEQGMAIRMVVGNVSLVILMGAFMLGGRRFFIFLKRRGWLPKATSSNPPSTTS